MISSYEHINVPASERSGLTNKLFSPFVVGNRQLDLLQLLGLKKPGDLDMFFTNGTSNILDFGFQSPDVNDSVLFHLRASIDEEEPKNPNHHWISIDFVHRFIDGDRGFQAWYRPNDMVNAADNYSLDNIQISPRQGESSFSRKSSIISIENIHPDMTHEELPDNFPYSLKYRNDEPDDVSLIAHDDGKYCKWPFNITLPARIGFSKEQFTEALKEVKRIEFVKNNPVESRPVTT